MNHPSITTINTEKDFDINNFNTKFEQEQEQKQLTRKPSQKIEYIEAKKLHQYTIGELLLEYKNSIINIIDELIKFRYNNIEEFTNIFLINNRLLYIGFTIILLSIFLFIFRNR
jgi:hypothetical protein